MKSIIVGITGASGVIYGVKILEVLSKLKIETHFIITQAGLKNLEIETNYTKNQVESIASIFLSGGSECRFGKWFLQSGWDGGCSMFHQDPFCDCKFL